MHIPLATTNYEDLIDNGLWIVVDAWAQQPHEDIDMVNKIQLNQYNYVFTFPQRFDEQTDIDMQDPLVQKTIKFILGELDSDTIVQQFIDKYSPEDYRNLRRAVLTTVVPDAQTEGMIKGVNNGGMKDDIGGMIGSSQPVAVSQDEYIIPADAVAMLGDGSSDSGAKKLDAMLDRIRMDKTGTTRQAKEIDNRVLPA